eukprot:scaffold33999_cov69-Phaeocystis_antarctica.AAC.1
MARSGRCLPSGAGGAWGEATRCTASSCRWPVIVVAVVVVVVVVARWQQQQQQTSDKPRPRLAAGGRQGRAPPQDGRPTGLLHTL